MPFNLFIINFSRCAKAEKNKQYCKMLLAEDKNVN